MVLRMGEIRDFFRVDPDAVKINRGNLGEIAAEYLIEMAIAAFRNRYGRVLEENVGENDAIGNEGVGGETAGFTSDGEGQNRDDNYVSSGGIGGETVGENVEDDSREKSESWRPEYANRTGGANVPPVIFDLFDKKGKKPEDVRSSGAEKGFKDERNVRGNGDRVNSDGFDKEKGEAWRVEYGAGAVNGAVPPVINEIFDRKNNVNEKGNYSNTEKAVNGEKKDDKGHEGWRNEYAAGSVKRDVPPVINELFDRENKGIVKKGDSLVEKNIGTNKLLAFGKNLVAKGAKGFDGANFEEGVFPVVDTVFDKENNRFVLKSNLSRSGKVQDYIDLPFDDDGEYSQVEDRDIVDVQPDVSTGGNANSQLSFSDKTKNIFVGIGRRFSGWYKHFRDIGKSAWGRFGGFNWFKNVNFSGGGLAKNIEPNRFTFKKFVGDLSANFYRGARDTWLKAKKFRDDVLLEINKKK